MNILFIKVKDTDECFNYNTINIYVFEDNEILATIIKKCINKDYLRITDKITNCLLSINDNFYPKERALLCKLIMLITNNTSYSIKSIKCNKTSINILVKQLLILKGFIFKDLEILDTNNLNIAIKKMNIKDILK